MTAGRGGVPRIALLGVRYWVPFWEPVSDTGFWWGAEESRDSPILLPEDRTSPPVGFLLVASDRVHFRSTDLSVLIDLPCVAGIIHSQLKRLRFYEACGHLPLVQRPANRCQRYGCEQEVCVGPGVYWETLAASVC